MSNVSGTYSRYSNCRVGKRSEGNERYSNEKEKESDFDKRHINAEARERGRTEEWNTVYRKPNDVVRKYRLLSQSYSDLKERNKFLESQLVSTIAKAEDIKTQFVIANHPDNDIRDDKYYIDKINQLCGDIKQMAVKNFRRAPTILETTYFTNDKSNFCGWCENICGVSWRELQNEMIHNRSLRIALIRGWMMNVLWKSIFGPVVPLRSMHVSNGFEEVYNEMAKVDWDEARKWRKHYFKTLTTPDLVEREAVSIRHLAEWVTRDMALITGTNQSTMMNAAEKIISKALEVAFAARSDDGCVTISLSGGRMGMAESVESVGTHSMRSRKPITIKCNPGIYRSFDRQMRPIELKSISWMRSDVGGFSK
ncbi:hypothetical protein NEOLI_001685 [Neolecta irregularis DAH-3]|uniref:Uncharacterized protein n=1 Tax=Neolecta irregularis (strain DAH-3) TaxID=1198029 RepID=A0A1U7LRD9_NEOID|nr:hypothetical protein NEOLI_001685 [Neolecta irregularis DAH-3]|eukprot:OLL25236.1 hypothetical protein NEOLI_001685 [Neolecta irregularis DAH-3]